MWEMEHGCLHRKPCKSAQVSDEYPGAHPAAQHPSEEGLGCESLLQPERIQTAVCSPAVCSPYLGGGVIPLWVSGRRLAASRCPVAKEVGPIFAGLTERCRFVGHESDRGRTEVENYFLSVCPPWWSGRIESSASPFTCMRARLLSAARPKGQHGNGLQLGSGVLAGSIRVKPRYAVGRADRARVGLRHALSSHAARSASYFPICALVRRRVEGWWESRMSGCARRS